MDNLKKNWVKREIYSRRKIRKQMFLLLLSGIIFLIFIVWLIGQVILFSAELKMLKSERTYNDVKRLSKSDYHITSLYWCPVESHICNTIVEVADKYGVNGQTMINLGWCESRLRAIQGEIDPRDNGWFQINSYWHPEIAIEDTYNLELASDFTAQMIAQGKGREWHCWDKIN